MSKLQVKIPPSTDLKIEKPKTVPSNVRTAVDEGQKLNLHRCQQGKPNEASSCSGVRQRKCPERDARIWKVFYPNEPKFCGCNHQNDFVLDRSLLSKREHLDYLALPKKVCGKYSESYFGIFQCFFIFR
jgi:hypothetical protein